MWLNCQRSTVLRIRGVISYLDFFLFQSGTEGNFFIINSYLVAINFTKFKIIKVFEQVRKNIELILVEPIENMS
jgi:hypothetical protein